MAASCPGLGSLAVRLSFMTLRLVLVGFYVWVRNLLGQQSKKLQSFLKTTELIIAELRGTEPFRTEACHRGLLALEPTGGIEKKKKSCSWVTTRRMITSEFL